MKDCYLSGMYLIEPILNQFYRTRMQALLHFDEADKPVHLPLPVETKPASFLYVHIPFCESLCPYCSFHRCEFEKDLAEKYFQALWKELRLYKELGYNFSGAYIGGGTPTVLMDRLIDTLDLLKETFDIREVSIETNPNHVTETNMRRLQQAGVNRLSVGVQSFDDAVLKQIGRYEKYGASREIQERLRAAMGTFDTLNVDLIFNIPCQSRASLESDLDVIDALLPDQVTFYPLMTAPSVERALKEKVGVVRYRREKEFYFAFLNRIRRHYQSSTAWCFSRKAAMIDEYIIDNEYYVGAGSGAFGYLNDSLLVNTFDLNEYIRRLDRRLSPVSRARKFSEKEKMRYFLLRKLFTVRAPWSEFQSIWGDEFRKRMAFDLSWLKAAGALRDDGVHLELSDRGMYYLVMAMREFFVAVDALRDECRAPAFPGDRKMWNEP